MRNDSSRGTAPAALTGTGSLVVRTYTARSAQPVEGAFVTVKLSTGETLSAQADEGGSAGPFSIPCPPRSLSLAEDNTQMPYAVCDVRAQAPGFDFAETLDVQIFDGVESMMEFAMLPAEDAEAYPFARPASLVDEVSTVPAHKLFAGGESSGPAPIQN